MPKSSALHLLVSGPVAADLTSAVCGTINVCGQEDRDALTHQTFPFKCREIGEALQFSKALG